MPAFDIPSERAMLALGAGFAARLSRGGGGKVVFLSGDLGAGKTTLARGILQGLGHAGAVTSPTYTLLDRPRLTERGGDGVDATVTTARP